MGEPHPGAPRVDPAVDPVEDLPRKTRGLDLGAVVGLVLGGGLIAVTYWVARRLQARGRQLWTNAPPLNGSYKWRFSANSLVAIAVAAAGAWWAPRLARDLRWRRLLWVSFAAALTWAVALAFADGRRGFLGPPAQVVDYSHTVAEMTSASAFLRGFVANIHTFAGHVRSHPPGYVLLLFAMRRAGLAGPWWQMALQLGAGAASVPAVLIAVREVIGEGCARRAAAFLTLAPAAVFWGSGDAFFLCVGAWGTTMIVLATGRAGRRSVLFALGGGLLFGYLLFLSYGMALLAIVPVAVALDRHRIRVLALAALPVLAVAAAFAASGFDWFAGFAAARREVAVSVQQFRPYWLFLFADLAALAAALGPAVWAALGRFALARPRDHQVWLIVGAALVAVAVADITGLSKGEVERIWLPFMPWIVAVTGAAFEGSDERGWLGVQVLWALGLQFLVRTPW